MRKWKVDKWCIGDPVDYEVSTEADVLAEALQMYENRGDRIQQIVWRESHRDYLIIYTTENDVNRFGRDNTFIC